MDDGASVGVIRRVILIVSYYRGVFASVFRGVNVKTGEDVALKV